MLYIMYDDFDSSDGVIVFIRHLRRDFFMLQKYVHLHLRCFQDDILERKSLSLLVNMLYTMYDDFDSSD